MSKKQSTETVGGPVAEAVGTPSAAPVADPWAGLEYDPQDWDDVCAVLEERRDHLYGQVSVAAGANPVSDAVHLGEVALEPLATLRDRVLSLPGPEGPRWVRAKDRLTKRVRLNGKLTTPPLPTPSQQAAPAAAVPTPPPPGPPPAPPPAPLAPAAVYGPGTPWPQPYQPQQAPTPGLDVSGLVRAVLRETGLLEQRGSQQQPAEGLMDFVRPVLQDLLRQRASAAASSVDVERSIYTRGFEDGRRVGRQEGKLDALGRAPPPDDDEEQGGGLLEQLAPLLAMFGQQLAQQRPGSQPPPQPVQAGSTWQAPADPAPPPAPAPEPTPEPAAAELDLAPVLRAAVEQGTPPRAALDLLEPLHPQAVAYLVEQRDTVLPLLPTLPSLSSLLSGEQGTEWLESLRAELERRAGGDA